MKKIGNTINQLDSKFESFDINKKMELLMITEDITNVTRFKGLAIEKVVDDLWRGKTNSQKRVILSNS